MCTFKVCFVRRVQFIIQVVQISRISTIITDVSQDKASKLQGRWPAVC
jgi:hypothetical protein